MKKALNAWAFPEFVPMEQRMAITRDAGFDGFEALFEAEGLIGLTTPDARLREIRAMADGLGLSLPSLVGTHYAGATLSTDDPQITAEFTRRFIAMIHAAAVLGADTVLLVPGRVESTRKNPHGQYDRAYDNALKNMAALARAAADEGVAIGVENVWNRFLLSPLEMRGFIDAVGSPWVGAYLDVGNMLAFGFPEQWIRILGSRIRKVHFKDYRVQVGNGGGGGFVDLLAGDVDFPEVMRAFREVGYDGYCTAEVSPYTHASELMAYQTARAMDVIFTMK